MRLQWQVPTLLAAMALGACSASSPGASSTNPADPDARVFTGTILSLRPTISLMLIGKEEHVGKDAFPNQVRVKYDANTKFFIDDQPATLDEIQQYMTVRIAGHMREGQLFAERAEFSSKLPENVRRAGGGK